MRVETQDGTYTAVRLAHNALRITTDTPSARERLLVFLGARDALVGQQDGDVVVRDPSWVEFLEAQTQDVQYAAFPIIAEQMFD